MYHTITRAFILSALIRIYLICTNVHNLQHYWKCLQNVNMYIVIDCFGTVIAHDVFAQVHVHARRTVVPSLRLVFISTRNHTHKIGGKYFKQVMSKSIILIMCTYFKDKTIKLVYVSAAHKRHWQSQEPVISVLWKCHKFILFTDSVWFLLTIIQRRVTECL